MSKSISKFRALSWPERSVLLIGILSLPLLWMGLRLFGLSRLQRWLSHPRAMGRPHPPTVEPARLANLVNIAGNYAPGGSTCLTRSLLLSWLLCRRGVHSELRIGVRVNRDVFEAHAWVECEGEPINAASDIGLQFAAFDKPVSGKSFS